MQEEIKLLNDLDEKEIKNLIYEFRDREVMLDSDIAILFNVETKNLNKAMKRNIDRFPEDFCFQLNSNELKTQRFQNVTFRSSVRNRKYLPYVYTEQGIIALAGVLKSEVADKMCVRISRVFIKMRTALVEYKKHLQFLSKYYGEFIDFKQFTVSKFDEIFARVGKLEPKKEVLLLSGEYFDAYEAIIKLIERAKESIVLVDPYADDKSLVLLTHKSKDVKVTIYKGSYSKLKEAEIEAFNKQYGGLLVKDYNLAHNRYLIIDSHEVYDLGTSINNMGGKIFTINKQEIKEVRDVLINMFII